MANKAESTATDEREDEGRHDRGSGGGPLCAIKARGVSAARGDKASCSHAVPAKPEEGDEQGARPTGRERKRGVARERLDLNGQPRLKRSQWFDGERTVEIKLTMGRSERPNESRPSDLDPTVKKSGPLRTSPMCN